MSKSHISHQLSHFPLDLEKEEAPKVEVGKRGTPETGCISRGPLRRGVGEVERRGELAPKVARRGETEGPILCAASRRSLVIWWRRCGLAAPPPERRERDPPKPSCS
mmetsp:Transcript_10567/g.34739  ORF Transcript_10567/g.34739 Transcript_10567/m.34739 type:complete len:107 (+) Transcript_10567:102-422(+)